MKIRVTSYAFDASAQTITAGQFSDITLEGIQLITNVTDNIIIYQFNNPDKGGSLSVDTLTLDYDTTSMDDNDKLMILVEDGSITQPVSGTVAVSGVATAANQSSEISELQDIEADVEAGNMSRGASSDAAATVGSTGTMQAKLRLITSQLDAVKTAVETLDNAISGSEMQIDVVAPLPAGNNNIGDVDIASSLPAGNNAIGKLAANSGVDIGDVDVTSVTPGTGATNLGKAEDAVHTTGDVGVMALMVRSDSDTPLAADGDYIPFVANAIGRAKVSALPAATTATTGNITTNTGTVSVDTLRQSGVTFQVTGTFSNFNGTFEASIDGGTTWNAVQAVRSNSNTVELTTGVISANPGYFWRVAAFNATNVRIRATALASGTVVVTGMPTAFASDPAPAVQSSNIGTVSSLGTGTTGPMKAEDVSHATGDMGIPPWTVRDDNASTTWAANGDYQPISSDLKGRVNVRQTASTGTSSNVSSSASNVTILGANSSRVGGSIYNDSTQILYIKHGATASTTSFKVALAPGGYYEIPAGYTGIIDGIWASANGNARVTEET